MDSEYKRLMSPSLSLLTLAALTPSGHKVIIQDANIEKIDFHDNPNLVGITVNVDTAKRAFAIAKNFQEKGSKVIAGGIYVSTNPQEALQHFDSICIGEAESVWSTILNDFQNNKLRKVYHQTRALNLANVPLPAWNLIKSKHYLYTNIIATSRGCPFKCDFCYNSSEYMQKPFRNRPITNVIAEIKQLKTKQVMFIDDNFIGNPSWTRDFLLQLKELNLTWHTAVSANLVNNLPLLDLMKESGCTSLFIGFESINPDSINSVQKRQNQISQYDKLIAEIHKREIMINASLVFGFDHDQPDVFKNTLDWLVNHKIETMTAHILTPYPGTKLYQKLLEEQRIIDFDTNHYNTAHVVFQPKQLTPQELFEGYLWIYRKFYSFRNILRRIPQAPRQKIPYLAFNLGYRKFGKITSLVGKLGFMSLIGKFGRRLAYNIE